MPRSLVRPFFVRHNDEATSVIPRDDGMPVRAITSCIVHTRIDIGQLAGEGGLRRRKRPQYAARQAAEASVSPRTARGFVDS